LNMDLLTPKILGFVLVLTRIGAFFATAPVFSFKAVPARIKLALTVFVSVFFAGIVAGPVSGRIPGGVAIGLMTAAEAVYGLCLGYVAAYIFAAVKISARVCERQMGLAMANVLDPLGDDGGQPLSVLMEMIFVLLFLSANGHHVFLITIAKSYETFPIGTVPAIDKLLESIVISGSTMLLLALKMSAPILAAFLLMMVILAIMARIAPETNILFLSLPLKVGLGMLMVSIFLPFMNSFVGEFAEWLDRFIVI